MRNFDKNFKEIYPLPDDIMTLVKEHALDDSGWYDLNSYSPNSKKGFYQKKLKLDLFESVIPKMGEFRPFIAYMLKTDPHYVIEKHIDDRTMMTKTALTWAVLPSLDKFSPTKFYVNGEECTYFYSNQGFVFDTFTLHAMEGNEHPRFLFQLRYHSVYANMIKKLRQYGYIDADNKT